MILLLAPRPIYQMTSIPCRDLGEEAAAQKALVDAQNMFPSGSIRARERHVSVCRVRAPKVSKPSTTKTQETKVHRVFFPQHQKTILVKASLKC